MNFDAKVRRESFEPIDLFHAHIGGMDAFARGLKIAAAIRADGELDAFVKERYAAGTAASARRSKRASTTSSRWKQYMLEKGERGAQQERPAGDAGEPDQPIRVGSQSCGGGGGGKIRWGLYASTPGAAEGAVCGVGLAGSTGRPAGSGAT